MTCRFDHVLLLPLALLAVFLSLPAAFAEGAKSLYYRQINQAAGEKKNIGLTYSIELTRNNKVAIVDSRYHFVSGDQLRFHVQANIDGYLYIVLKQGSRGDSALLFPAAGSAESNYVKSGQDIMVPEKGVLEFDQVAGTEKVKLVLSPQKLIEDPDKYSRSVMISPKHSAQAIASQCLIDFALDPAGTIEFKKSDDALNFRKEPAVTVVSTNISKPLAVEMDLEHGMNMNSPVTVALATPVNTASPAGSGLKPVWAAAADSAKKANSAREANTSSSPSDRAPSAVTAPGLVKDKWAVIVGISEFKDPKWNLLYPAKDAEDLAAFLVKEGNFSADHVKLLTNAEASRENILSVLGGKWLPQNVKPGDIVFVYFASHGTSAAQDLARKNFLVAYDTDPKNAFATGIELQDLARTIKRRLDSDRIVIVLDTCHSGSADPGAKSIFGPQSFSYEDLIQGTGQLVIASARENQIAHDSLRYKNGIFTKHFMDGLKKNKKLEDAFTYTSKMVDAESKQDFNQSQSPVLKAADWQGSSIVLLVPPQEPRKVQE